MAISVAEVLDRAADLIEPEGKWTQGQNAKDASGLPIRPSSPRASCFCAIGAVNHVISKHKDLPVDRMAAFDLMDATMDATMGGIVSFNDAPERRQAEVVAKLRECATRARELEI